MEAQSEVFNGFSTKCAIKLCIFNYLISDYSLEFKKNPRTKQNIFLPLMSPKKCNLSCPGEIRLGSAATSKQLIRYLSFSFEKYI